MLLSTHADRQGVDISFTVCVFVCVFVRLRISPPRIKLATSNFARRFIGVQGRESQISVNFAPQKPIFWRIGQRAGHAHLHANITVEMSRVADVNVAIEMRHSWNLNRFAIYHMRT